MAREAQGSDFEVKVDGFGAFVFARRNVNDAFMIRGRYAQVTGGNYDDKGRAADYSALAFVTIETLLVAAPRSFSLNPDPLMDEEWDVPFMKVFAALRAKELSFRPRKDPAGEGPGPGNGEHVPPVVPADVPAGAD
jgi:hypothetical protein